MNATSPNDFMEAVENHSGIDSDTNIDHDDAVEYYQPVSAVDSEDDDQHLQNDVVAVVSHSQLLDPQQVPSCNSYRNGDTLSDQTLKTSSYSSFSISPHSESSSFRLFSFGGNSSSFDSTTAVFSIFFFFPAEDGADGAEMDGRDLLNLAEISRTSTIGKLHQFIPPTLPPSFSPNPLPPHPTATSSPSRRSNHQDQDLGVPSLNGEEEEEDGEDGGLF